MHRIPNNSSLSYERNILNYKNIYPIYSDTSNANPQIFYNDVTKEITYNPNNVNVSTDTETTASTSSPTYTMPSNSAILFATASSNAIAITLPTAVGISGIMYKIIRTDTTLANPITITTTSSQTIGGSGTTRKMYTANEVWEFVSDGLNWIILNHFAKTDYISAGSQTIASTSNPQPGIPSYTFNELLWKRDGKMIHILFKYLPASTPSAGTGDYIFNVVPTGITIDTSIYSTYSAEESSGSYAILGSIALGQCIITTGGGASIGTLVPYSSTQVRMFFHTIISALTTFVVGSSSSAISNTRTYKFSCVIPIFEFDD